MALFNSKILPPHERIRRNKPNASVFLMITTVLAVIIANSPLVGLYNEILNYPIALQIGSLNIFSHHGETMSLLAFTNDVLMVLFFLQVGLEIKTESLVGELSSFKKALLPIVGAVGGMIFPVLIFLSICHTAPASNGAAIPMATDIAFTLAVLGLMGSKVPPALKTFITTLAVADDIGGIIVIALFYSTGIHLQMLLWAGLTLLALFIIGKMGINKLWIYYLGLFVTWFFFLKSGIHTTIAGVLVAFTVPSSALISTKNLRTYAGSLLNTCSEDEQRTKKKSVLLPHKQIEAVNYVRYYATAAICPIQRMEFQLGNLVNYLVLPLFAFVNAGVTFGSIQISELAGIPLAITLGLFLGKFAGIFLFSYLFIRIMGNKWPTRMTPANLAGVSILGGIGFTVSLFISTLSYSHPETASLLNDAKLGIFAGSLISGFVGYYVLKSVLHREHAKGLL